MFSLRKSAVLIIALVMVLTFGLMGCGSDSDTDDSDKLKVGFVFVGPAGDHGWSYTHDQGRKYLEEELPYVKTTTLESVSDNDAEKAITQLVEQGNKIIFTTSFGFMDPTISVAEKYPDVTFMHCSGYKTAGNAGNYFGRIYQPRYLSGLAAGKMTKTNVIGYVAAFPIPEVVRGINAFTLGVREVNPDAVVKVVWTQTWLDPPKEKDAAKSLLEQNADVIAQHQDSPGPLQAAEEKGVYSIGYNCDMSKFAPKGYLTSPVWNWGPYYVDVVKSVKEGTWKSEAYWGSMADQVVDLAAMSSLVPDDVKKLVEDKKGKITSGEWDVFTGPIKDQKGNIKVPEGKKMSDEEMLGFDWFVEGVEGTIDN
ncbi:BMP family ABC transporter substrate-binding protein [Syntrophaceticus schinkii]|jgi:basic membrane protein A|uniref:Purine-binding protein BAB2_0673 n=1 Tax=Syntrophaceticus schinkii TaxID=499207 RepID=A0A0B7MMB2_9FIRM|nr:BMP family ABC transporter substrate-binding protein [Syntrophaceticus schinkii]CEO89373.1 Purine-binding protein BAB2_0673 [Syntrophaceticus schinkii]